MEDNQLLFCNITYMKYYNGDDENDRPVHGGKYVDKTGDAYEKNNFREETDGYYYGFVETKYNDGYESGKYPKKIHIEKINSQYKGKEYIENVTVVFCAKSDILDTTVIVGWYKNATVYRDRKTIHGRQYNIKAKVEDSYLIPVINRTYVIPRAINSDEKIGFGQSGLWYANNIEEEKIFALKVKNYIDNYTQEVYLDADRVICEKNTYEILNKYMGTRYNGWMQACWPEKYADKQFRVWFPKLANTRNEETMAATSGYINIISDDWNEIVFDDTRKRETEDDKRYKFDGHSIVFAMEPNNGLYIFRGIYDIDNNKTELNHLVYKGIATKVKIIGAPAFKIELIDEICDDIPLTYEEQEKQAISLPDERLFKIAKMYETDSPKKRKVKETEQFVRNPYIAEATKRRANGICQLCRKAAPFTRSDGNPYLESHHIIWLSDGGSDSLNNTVALCPNCHRKMHIINDKKDIIKLQNSNKKINLTDSDNVVGKEVYHEKYGIGIINALDDKVIEVYFNTTVKKFMRESLENGTLVLM